MDEYAEISDFLRYLMEHDRKRRSDAERNAHQIARTDDQSVDQIMHGISDEIHGGDRMRMGLCDRHMAVIPADDLFRDQPEEYPSQQRKRNEQRQSFRRYSFRQ